MTLEEILALDQWPIEPSKLGFAAAVGIGALYCFVGYRFFKLVLALTGFLLSGSLAAFLGSWVSQGDQTIMLGVGLLGGVAGAYSMFYLYRVGVFFLGTLGALVIANAVLSVYEEVWAPAIAVGVGLLGGFIALFLEKAVMTLATAALGAWVCVCGIALLITESADTASVERFITNSQVGFGLMASWLVLTLVGAYVQWTGGAAPPEIVKETVREYKK